MSQLSELVRQGKAFLESKDYEACMKLMSEALDVAPRNAVAAAFLEEARRKREDQCLAEELVTHTENLKRDAVDLFEQGKYEDCVRMFKFVCELDPKNRTLRDYLELSQLKLQEAEDAALVKPNLSSSPAPDSPAREITPSPPSPLDSSSGISSSTEEQAPSISVQAGGRETSTDAKSGTVAPEQPESPRDDVDFDGEIDDAAEASGSKKSLFIVAGLVAIMTGVLAGWLFLRSPQSAQLGSLEIQSEPSNAKVFVDGEFRGQTRLKLESLAKGQHLLRVEKQGYTPVSQAFTIEGKNPASLSVQLEGVKAEPVSIGQLEEEARELFDRGRLLDASQRSDVILGLDSENAIAAALKSKIQNNYWQQSQRSLRRGKVEDARLALENLLQLSPKHAGALRELKALKAKSTKHRNAMISEESRLKSSNGDLHRRIAAAMNLKNYFPPASGNALELTQRLGETSATDPVFKDTMDQLQRESISQLQRKIQSKDLEGAKALAGQFLSYFPASPELRNFRESLSADESRHLEARNGLLQKLESALARRNYVIPANDSALSYCNRLLGLDPQNPKIQALRKEALTKAASQASDLTTQQKFEEARDILSVLLSVAQSEGRPPVVEELTSKLGKLEFSAYAVIHDHTLGSCSGRLRMNSYIISYIPSGDARDGFSEKLSEVGETDAGDKLKVQIKNKTYRFQANLSKTKEENRRKVEQMRQKLNELMK